MIKITYDVLGKVEFQRTISRIHASKYKTQEAPFFQSFSKKLTEATKKMQEDYRAMVADRFAEKDEKGELIDAQPSDENPSVFKLKPGTKEEYQKAEADFGKVEVEIGMEPFRYKKLYPLGEISPKELDLLAPFIQAKSLEEEAQG